MRPRSPRIVPPDEGTELSDLSPISKKSAPVFPKTDLLESIARGELEKREKQILETDFGMAAGGTSISYMKGSVKASKKVPQYVSEQWPLIQAAKQNQKDGKKYTAYEALVDITAMAQFASQRSHKGRSAPTQQYYQSYEDTFSTFDPKKGTTPPEKEALAKREIEFNAHLHEARKKIETVKKTGHSIEQKLYDHIHDGVMLEKAYISHAFEQINFITEIGNELKAKGYSFNEEAIIILKNSFERMINATTVEEMNLYKDSIAVLLNDIATSTAPKTEESGPLWDALGRLTTNMQRSINSYTDIHADIMIGLDKKYAGLYITALSSIATSMLGNTQLPFIPLPTGATEHILKVTTHSPTAIGALQTSDYGHDSERIAPAQSSSEAFIQFFEATKKGITDNKIPIGLSVVGVISAIVCPPLLAGAAAASGLHSTARILSEGGKLSEMTNAAIKRLDDHEAEYQHYLETLYPERYKLGREQKATASLRNTILELKKEQKSEEKKIKSESVELKNIGFFEKEKELAPKQSITPRLKR